jgi:hypothetical protein
MDSSQRKLVELQEAILKLSMGEKTNPDLIKQAQYSLAGGRIDTGPGNDTVIINQGADNGTQCVQGIQGTQGVQGPGGGEASQGIQGIQGLGGESGEAGSQGVQGLSGSIGPIGPTGECTCQCQAILVSEDYSADRDDYYIGVNSDGPTVIQLPCNSRDCDEIVIKAEMGPPVGNRKITIIPCQDSTACKIDGDDSYVIEVPYQSVKLIYRGGNWWII